MTIKRFIVSAIILLHSSLIAAGETFDFIVLGDTAYTGASYAEYERLIERIDTAKPDFTIHVGDTLGYQPCSNESYDRIEGFFGRFKAPLVYTPGL